MAAHEGVDWLVPGSPVAADGDTVPPAMRGVSKFSYL